MRVIILIVILLYVGIIHANSNDLQTWTYPISTFRQSQTNKVDVDFTTTLQTQKLQVSNETYDNQGLCTTFDLIEVK